MNIVNLVAALRNTNSSIEKVRLLQKADTRAIEIIKLAYDPDVTYGIKFPNIRGVDFASSASPEDFTKFKIYCGSFATRNISGDEARATAKRLAFDWGDLVYNILDKDLRCGISHTTINKALPGTLPQFKVQLAKEVPLIKLKFPLWAQRKYDGVRLLAIVSLDKVIFKTRNGKQVRLDSFNKVFSECTPGIYDGEVIFNHGKSADRTTVSGLINSAIHGSAIDESNLAYTLFDFLEHSEMNSLKCDTPYSLRMKKLAEFAPLQHHAITLASTYKVTNAEQVNDLYKQQIDNGFEGLILKPMDHKYTFKRSKDWVKMKEIKSADLRCVGVAEGKGKYENQIGALICRGTVEGQLVRVEVGSGLTDEDRSRHEDYYKGKTIEVKYNSVISKHDDPGKFSLFLPRYVTVRGDK